MICWWWVILENTKQVWGISPFITQFLDLTGVGKREKERDGKMATFVRCLR